MSAAAVQPPSRGGGAGSALALAVTVVTLGLFGNLPFPFGGVLGATGAVVSIVLREVRPFRSSSWAALPVVLALSVESVTAPAGAAPELLAGLSALAFLAWWADDPGRPTGGIGRAASALTMIALGIGVAWTIVLVGPRESSDVGVAGALLAVGLAVLAILLARSRRPTADAGGSGVAG